MHQVWLFSLAQCVLSVAVIGVSIRLCMGLDPGRQARSVSSFLKLCLGCVGAIGAAVGVPVNMLLNLRSSQCLYTCAILVCCPLLVRQFTVCLLLLLSINTHLQCRLGHRYAVLVTRPRILCLVLLSWLCSVVTAFAQFILSNSLDTWGTAGLGFGGLQRPNQTSLRPPPKLPYHEENSVIGKYLPYGGFLSKFLVEDLQNFTYAEIHSSHWGVCASDLVLSPAFLVYVYDVAVFFMPLIILLIVYVDQMCVMPRRAVISNSEGQKQASGWSRSLTVSLSLLVVLCLPLHIFNAIRLFAPSKRWPHWVVDVASFFFQAYSLVPPLLFTYSAPNMASGGESSTLGTATSQQKFILTTPLDFCPPDPKIERRNGSRGVKL
ncbi:adenosine receptor A2b-like [Trichomycterus rosablanca]|uniref:adenosine receptor A2b-like n=1 Tax=Trichomycterus rosablanca TaxID=2290929 RepID=UPI002F34FB91